jgi:hypothetical protein
VLGAAGNLGDMPRFNVLERSWSYFSNQNAAVAAPSARSFPGLAAAGGKLFLFGGLGRSTGSSPFRAICVHGCVYVRARAEKRRCGIVELYHTGHAKVRREIPDLVIFGPDWHCLLVTNQFWRDAYDGWRLAVPIFVPLCMKEVGCHGFRSSSQ